MGDIELHENQDENTSKDVLMPYLTIEGTLINLIMIMINRLFK